MHKKVLFHRIALTLNEDDNFKVYTNITVRPIDRQLFTQLIIFTVFGLLINGRQHEWIATATKNRARSNKSNCFSWRVTQGFYASPNSHVSPALLGLNEILFFRCCAAYHAPVPFSFVGKYNHFYAVSAGPICADMVCERLLLVSILFNRIFAISGHHYGAATLSWRPCGLQLKFNRRHTRTHGKA